MSASRFLAAFFLCAAAWLAAFLALTWLIDPYGVSPLGVSLSGLNEHKPKRRSIDRYIKPYEVWKYQPRTVFIGSSRMLQSMDTRLLDGTRFAPAYNAAVSGATMDQDADHLEAYLRLDPNLKYAFVELFIWQVLLPQQPEPPREWLPEFVRNSVALQLSGRTLLDAAVTVKANRERYPRGQYVDRHGRMIFPPDWNAKLHFDAYHRWIVPLHKHTVVDFKLHPSTFRGMDRMVQLCREHGVELYFVVLPNNPYDDYRLQSFGYWEVLEQWQRRIAAYPNVLGFSQYTAPLIEPPSERMVYWYDPLHPSARYGELMLRAFLGERDAAIPADILLPINQDTVETVLEKRRSGLRRWIAANPAFVTAFEEAKVSAGIGNQQGSSP
jgi:hypothetical protein